MKTIVTFISQICLLFTAYCLLFSPVHAEIADRVIAVVNDSAITLSELNMAAAGLSDIKGNEKENKEKIVAMRSNILDQLIEKKLVELSAFKAGISVSEKEIDNAIEDVKKQNNIAQENLLSVLAKNGLTFNEYRAQLKDQIRQVKFINKEFRANIKISYEDVETYYKQNKDKYSATAMYRIRIISLLLNGQRSENDLSKKANEVLARARKGEDFSKLVLEYSENPSLKDGGDIGYISPGEMDAQIEKTAAELKTGETSGVIKTQSGFHIIQLVDRRKTDPKPISEVQDEIKNNIFQKIMDERYKIWLEDKIKNAYIEVRL